MQFKSVFLFVLVVGLFSTFVGWSQPEYVNDNFPRNYDHIYKDNIKSVQMIVNNQPVSYPVLRLGSTDRLFVSFDDLDNDVKDYSYRITLCNSDWTPSDLTELEYIDGFAINDIPNYEFSFNTLTPFTFYQFTLPNNDLRWTKSGNYLLEVFEDNDTENLVFTRRFMVHENVMQIRYDLNQAFQVGKSQTHHEIDFVVDHQGIIVRNPRQEIKVVVMQNGRMDNAITDLPPLFIRESSLDYDYQNKVVFQAGREFREFDTRSTRYKAEGIKAFYDDGEQFYFTVFPDPVRANFKYEYYQEVNGQYAIQNFHEDDNNLESDYGTVFFQLNYDQELPKGDIYLFGKLTDWQFKEEFKMKYSPELQAYIGDAFLKQGYYNYMYAYVEDGSEEGDFELIEGNNFQAENDYQIFVYYRPFGARYERLVAYEAFNSFRF